MCFFEDKIYQICKKMCFLGAGSRQNGPNFKISGICGIFANLTAVRWKNRQKCYFCCGTQDLKKIIANFIILHLSFLFILTVTTIKVYKIKKMFFRGW